MLFVLAVLSLWKKEEGVERGEEKKCVDVQKEEVVSCSVNGSVPFSRIYCMKSNKYRNVIPVGYDSEYVMTTVTFSKRGCVGVKCSGGCSIVREEGDKCCRFITTFDVLTRGRGELHVYYKRDLWYMYMLYCFSALFFLFAFFLAIGICRNRRKARNTSSTEEEGASRAEEERGECIDSYSPYVEEVNAGGIGKGEEGSGETNFNYAIDNRNMNGGVPPNPYGL